MNAGIHNIWSIVSCVPCTTEMMTMMMIIINVTYDYSDFFSGGGICCIHQLKVMWGWITTGLSVDRGVNIHNSQFVARVVTPHRSPDRLGRAGALWVCSTVVCPSLCKTIRLADNHQEDASKHFKVVHQYLDDTQTHTDIVWRTTSIAARTIRKKYVQWVYLDLCVWLGPLTCYFIPDTIF